MDIVNILRDKILNSVNQLVDERNFKHPININNIVVERPRKQHQGDYSTNAAMVLGKVLSYNPRDLGEIISLKLVDGDLISNVSLDGPGFLNITINSKFWDRLIYEINSSNYQYGEERFGGGKKVN